MQLVQGKREDVSGLEGAGRAGTISDSRIEVESKLTELINFSLLNSS